MVETLLGRMARLRGIGAAYHDYRGELQHFSEGTQRELLRAMGCAVDDAAQLQRQVEQVEIDDRRFLPWVAAGRGGRLYVDVNISAREFGAALLWMVQCEDGTSRNGVVSSTDLAEVWRGEVGGVWITARRFDLPCELAPGYHDLQVSICGGAVGQCRIIMSPSQCHEPAPIVAGRRLWGMAVQLYTLRSRGNWGIGDFEDLKQLIRWVAAHGAGFVGLNPLHALAPADPKRASPYSASSRHFLNVLYICVPAVAEFDACDAAKARLSDSSTLALLDALRGAEQVDYCRVAAVKFEILALLYQDFCRRHLAPVSDRGGRFQRFVAAGGKLLEAHARFDALDRYFRATLGVSSGWMNWPEEYRDVNGEAAARFAAEHPDEVRFYAYLQWLAHEQLSEAQRLARELGMPIGLYGDFAVGANPGGSETWTDRHAYCCGAEIGAPPDPLALKGQGWGIPPQDPQVMRTDGLHSFSTLISNNMSHYGALRLDHVMSLFRLWWVPKGSSPVDGAYIHYPLQLLLAVLALESARNECLVVGEDLGVVPDEMRNAMPDYGLYHYKVLLFEKMDGRFRRPDEFTARALAAATTHDMPTLRSFWEGADIELRGRLNLYPSDAMAFEVAREREHDRQALLRALQEEGVKPELVHGPADPFCAELAHAMHLYLARSRALLVALQLEDLLGMIDPVNVPGTDREYPNWQRKMTADLEQLTSRQDLSARLHEIRLARG